MTTLQEFLINGNDDGLTSEDLFLMLDAYGILAKRHPQYPNLVHFKYGHAGANWAIRMVQESRAIILDENNDWNCVARSFDKFFNHTEGYAPEIDWSTARVQEKLDGSLTIMYYYDNQWHVASSGTPDASGTVNDHGFTFRDLFFRVLAETDSGYPINGAGFTFIFELMTRYNRIVVDHQESRLVLLGVRYGTTGEWLDPAQFVWSGKGPEVVKEFPLNSIPAILASFDAIDPLSQEGYVVVDGNHNRVKIKHPGYVAIHHSIFGLTKSAMMEVVMRGETPEVLSAFPQFEADFKSLVDAYDLLAAQISHVYEQLKDIFEQKEFALQATMHSFYAVLFMMRKAGTSDPKVILRTMDSKKVMKLCGGGDE